MALPYFYEPGIAATAGHFSLSEETSRHCIQVLRMKLGEQIQLTDGNGLLYIATIVGDDKKKTVVTLASPVQVSAPAKKISIAISLLKNASRFEWFLEKATEIGISAIQPLICSRTEHTRFRHDRMNGILVSAMLQSQQAWLPVLAEPVSFAAVIQQTGNEQKLIAHCEEGSKQLIKDLPPSNHIKILIGPEGDFTPAEINLALAAGYMPVGLGDTRLRTETAGMVAASLLVNQ